jgi:hypothetical protein
VFDPDTAEPWYPVPPDDVRPLAEECECFCGTVWFPDYEPKCPGCGREEINSQLDDKEWKGEE